MRKLTYNQKKKIIETLLTAIFTCAAIAFGFSSCKAWRTICTTASYTQVTDSSKVTSTIQTKTTEEYQGARKQ